MRRDRFFVPTNYVGGSLAWSSRGLAHQLKNVLRLGGEKEIYLFNGQGQEAKARVLAIKGDELLFEILSVQNLEELTNRVTLYVSLLKKNNFELVIQKATEVGVAKIVPLITARTVKQGFKIQRWQVIAQEAAEQSGRLVVPAIEEPVTFSKAVCLAKQNHHSNLIFEFSGARPKKISGNIGIFVGPEGGFAPEEVVLADEAGFDKVSLGDFVLRAETAAIVGAFVAVRGWS